MAKKLRERRALGTGSGQYGYFTELGAQKVILKCSAGFRIQGSVFVRERAGP